MTIVPTQLEKFKHNTLPLPLDSRYHGCHGAAVKQELHPVQVQAHVHRGDQTGVFLQEIGVVQLKLHSCLREGWAGCQKGFKSSLVGLFSPPAVRKGT